MKALLRAHGLLISMQWTFYVAMPVLCCFLPGQSSAAEAVGPLRVHPANPRYFTDGTRNPDGSPKWSFQLGGSDNMVESSPAIDSDGIIYIGSNVDNHLYAINPDGTQRWKIAGIYGKL